MAKDFGETPRPPADDEIAIEKNKCDPLGDMVCKIYVRTQLFTIYRAHKRAGDFGRLRYSLSGDNAQCQPLRRNLAPVIAPIAQITDMVCSVRPNGLLRLVLGRPHQVFSERCLELMAKAKQMALDGDGNQALAMLARLRVEVESRRDSRNRMRYIFANFTAIVAILLVWGVTHGFTQPEGLLSAFVTGDLPLGTSPPALNYVDLLVLGALGAFLSVSVGLNSLKVVHSITLTEMVYAGFVRILIGVIAALIIVVLIQGNWMLGAINPELKNWAIYLFAFLAGFSEFFVPNALKQVESGTQVEPPAPSGQVTAAVQQFAADRDLTASANAG